MSPHPSPSAIPAARATTFFSAAPNSIPSTSGLAYTRNASLINTPWIYSAVFFRRAPATIAVGSPFPTSSAWDGPESTATSACGTSSSITCESVISVFSSIPFATFTSIWPGHTTSLSLAAVLRVKGEGTASTRRSIPSTASFKSVVKRVSSESRTPGSFSFCSLSFRSISISSESADQTVT